VSVNTEIKAVTEAELPLLLDLVRQYWAFEDIPGFDAVRLSPQLSMLCSREHLGRAWIATVAGQPAGYLIGVYVFSLEHAGLTAEIDEFFVLAQHRGRRVGSALLRVAESEFAAAGCSNVSLQLSRNNDPARNFYRRHGYAERAGYELLDKMLA
jgi:ribosomal protein S18 acetylase RimI-like enzyme